MFIRIFHRLLYRTPFDRELINLESERRAIKKEMRDIQRQDRKGIGSREISDRKMFVTKRSKYLDESIDSLNRRSEKENLNTDIKNIEDMISRIRVQVEELEKNIEECEVDIGRLETIKQHIQRQNNLLLTNTNSNRI